MTQQRHSPNVTCAFCQKTDWQLLKSRMMPHAAEPTRFRIYGCQTCQARLYTHEYIIHRDLYRRPHQCLLPPRQSEMVCQLCGGNTWRKRELAKRDPAHLREWLWVCDTPGCGCSITTAESPRGMTEKPTPRSERGRRPHPFITR